MIWIVSTPQPQSNQLKVITVMKIHGLAGVVGGIQKNPAVLMEMATGTGLSNAKARIAPNGESKMRILDRKSVLTTQKKQRTTKGHDLALDGVDDEAEAEAANEGEAKRETENQLLRRIPTMTLC